MHGHKAALSTNVPRTPAMREVAREAACLESSQWKYDHDTHSWTLTERVTYNCWDTSGNMARGRCGREWHSPRKKLSGNWGACVRAPPTLYASNASARPPAHAEIRAKERGMCHSPQTREWYCRIYDSPSVARSKRGRMGVWAKRSRRGASHVSAKALIDHTGERRARSRGAPAAGRLSAHARSARRPMLRRGSPSMSVDARYEKWAK